MFGRMVVFLYLHSLCVGELNETSSACNGTEKSIRLCCNQTTDGCESSFERFFENFSVSGVDLTFGRPCDKMEPVDISMWSFENGKLLSESTREAINLSKHCLHLTTDNNDTSVQLCVCESPQGDIEKFHKSLTKVIGTSISLPLLIITLFVLWRMQQFKTNHGKCLMCHIMSLTLLYIFLILDRMNFFIAKIPWLCELSGYMMYISILFCIFWLNVLCFDIWWTFRSTKNPQYSSDSEKFLKYLFYGFGLPLIMTMVVAIIDETTWFPVGWRPQIGKPDCFLRNDRDIEFAYLYLPMSIILLVNVVLYSITAFKIYSVQNDKFILSGKIGRRRVVSCNPIRMRFLLYLRLFLLMGLTWSMEAASWVYDANSILDEKSSSFFIISDVVNSIHGFVIFGLFVCRSKALDSVLTKNRSTNKIGSSMILGRLQDSKRNSETSDETLAKFLREKRSVKETRIDSFQ